MAQNRMQERIRSSALGTAIMSLVAFYLGDRIGAYIVFGLDMQLGNQVTRGLQALIAKPLYLDLNMMPLLYGFILCAIVWLVWLRYVVFVGNYRTGEESGSAQWGSEKQGLAFRDQTNSSNNLLFTRKYGLALKQPKFNEETYRNLNVCVIGGSGSGKTKRYVKPNLMQLNANYFVTDPKGTLPEETGYLFIDNGYKLKSFNTVDFSKSQHYNPLAYVKTDAEILSFVNCFIMNTNDPTKTGGESFWEDSERLLYTALIALLRDWFPKKDYSLDGLLTLFSLAKASENDESYESPLDMLFKEIETGKAYRKNPAYYAKKRQKQQQAAKNAVLQRGVVGLQSDADIDEPEYTYQASVMKRADGVRPAECGGLSDDEDFALSNYNSFKQAAGKTLKSILISCNVRLMKIRITEVRELLKYDEMELDKLGDKDSKMVIFAVLSDTDHTFSFLHAIMMWQAIDILCRRANIKYHGKLPRMVNFIFDEFANIGKLPDIEHTISVVRSRNIAISIILQSMAQLDTTYDKAAKTIVDCCDTMIFLGGKSTYTNKEISEMIGDETIHQTTFGESHGQSPSGSKNMQIQGRKLIDPAEIGKMSRKDAILLIAGTDPLKDKKYDPAKHPNYIYLDPGDNRKCIHDKPIDIKKYLAGQKVSSSSTASRKEA